MATGGGAEGKAVGCRQNPEMAVDFVWGKRGSDLDSQRDLNAEEED